MSNESSPPAPPAKAATTDLVAYILPFAVFMLGLAAVGLVQRFAEGDDAPLWLREPQYWIYPLQAVLVAAALLWGWRRFDWGAHRGIGLGALVGVGVFFLWIFPQMFLGVDRSEGGFDPNVFGEDASLYWMTLAGRFFRLVIVVPIMEEVFWRGFLMRYMIREDFRKAQIGQYTPVSFWVVTIMFALAHWGPDFIPALLTGAIFGWVTVKTKSLAAVIVCHAVTNLLLGIYILQTGQWGFW